MRLFSPWAEVVDPAAARLLAPTGLCIPRRHRLPGRRRLDRTVSAAARLGAGRPGSVRFGTTVTGVARAAGTGIVGSGREERPFTVHVGTADSREERITARAVIDASGTQSAPGLWARTVVSPAPEGELRFGWHAVVLAE